MNNNEHHDWKKRDFPVGNTELYRDNWERVFGWKEKKEVDEIKQEEKKKDDGCIMGGVCIDCQVCREDE